VPPRVRYVMTCSLISEIWVCVLFESNGEGMAIPGIRMVQEGPERGEVLVECNIGQKEPL
jgi:hypothetical protein